MPLIPALGRQRQAGLCEFEASLVYRGSYRTGSIATGKPASKNENKIKQKKERTGTREGNFNQRKKYGDDKGRQQIM